MIFNKLSDFFLIDSNVMEMIIRLLLSFLAGFIIGFERERSGHPAGLKTHILVCVGACLVMLISMYAFGDASDPARLAAQVVSGMGFIGAGAIMRDNSGGIKGITTAATLWVTAMIGLGFGSGLYIITILAILLVTGALVFIKRFEVKFIRKNSVITLICRSDLMIANIVIGTFSENNIEIKDFVISPISKDEKAGYAKVTITLTADGKMKPNVQLAISTLRGKLEPKSFHIKNS